MLSSTAIFKYILCFFFTVITATTFSQTALKVGDTIPDVVFKNVINYKNTSLRLSQFKSKLILLDLWGLTCVSCIEAFPTLDSLQRKFNKDMTLLLVNDESRDSTILFFEKRKKISPPGVPLITADKLIYKYFPASGRPYNIWIDSNLVVRHITYSTFTTEENIKKFIAGIPFDVVELDFTKDRPFLQPLGSDLSSRSVSDYYSAFARHVPGVRNIFNTFAMEGNGKQNRVVIRGASPLTLIKYAIGKGNSDVFYHPNQVILQVKDTSKYIPPKDKIAQRYWSVDKSYDYELQVPTSRSEILYKRMLEEVSFLLQVKVTVEKRQIKVMALQYRSSNEQPPFKTKGGKPLNGFGRELEGAQRELINKPFSAITGAFQAIFEHTRMPVPFVDEVKYSGNVDIALSKLAFDNMDIKSLNNELAPYNLQIVMKDAWMDVLVIKDL